ncbi:casein kinase I-like [Penaeus chinensis]|uniref:casein kinase I-like n=1 Tax=Penaeus chinensis TaxID=139456 RepID=UPI001FB6CBAA|nr:casein kinase I-like [Penaeus chinensis]
MKTLYKKLKQFCTAVVNFQFTTNNQMEDYLAKGGYGKVYLRKLSDGRDVIVKVNCCKGKVAVTYHEAAILAYLNGRGGAPKLISTTFRKGLLVMEYIKGITVEKLIKCNEMNGSQWLSVLCAIAKRIQEIHQAGIIHSDFKPDNCLITFDEEGNPDAHIIDFGLSTKIGQRSTLSRGHEETW